MFKYCLNKLSNVILLLGIVCSVSSQGSLSFQDEIGDYTIEGTLSVVGIFKPDLSLTNVYDFTLYRTSDNWKILMELTESSYQSGITKEIFGLITYTNYYHLSYLEESSNTNSLNDNILKIYPYNIPSGHVSAIWLALIGGETLDKTGKGFVKTPFPPGLGFRECHFTLPAEWEFYGSNQILKSYIEYSDGYSYSEENGQFRRRKFSKKITNLTNACYQVVNWTNVLEKDFPRIAVLDTYPVLSYNITENQLHEQYTLEIKRIQRGVHENIFQLNVPPKTMVHDSRLLSPSQIPAIFDYFSETGELRSLESIRSDQRINDLMINTEAKISKRNSWKIYTVFVICLCLPFLFFFKKEL